MLFHIGLWAASGSGHPFDHGYIDLPRGPMPCSRIVHTHLCTTIMSHMHSLSAAFGTLVPASAAAWGHCDVLKTAHSTWVSLDAGC